LEVSILLFTFAPVMLGQASAIKARNQVSEYPPLSKLAGCFLCTTVLAAKIRQKWLSGFSWLAGAANQE